MNIILVNGFIRQLDWTFSSHLKIFGIFVISLPYFGWCWINGVFLKNLVITFSSFVLEVLIFILVWRQEVRCLVVIITLFGISTEFSLHCNSPLGKGLLCITICWVMWGEHDSWSALGNRGALEHITPLHISLRCRKNKWKAWGTTF